MAFSLECPGFAIDVSDQVDVHQSDSGVLQSFGNLSTLGILLAVPAYVTMGG